MKFNKKIKKIEIVAIKTILLTVLFGGFAGCGKTVRDFGVFGPYVDRFEAYSKQYGSNPTNIDNLVIRFGTLPPKTLGECTQGLGTPTITINQFTWESLTSTEKETLLFHEMGHCVRGRPHSNDSFEPQRKWRSIMLAWPQKITDYEQNKEGYLAELFGS